MTVIFGLVAVAVFVGVLAYIASELWDDGGTGW